MSKKKTKRKPAPQQKPRPQMMPQVVQPTGKKATVSLSIIVKNEAKVIERMLNTVYPILDYYVVVDTGLTEMEFPVDTKVEAQPPVYQ